MMNERQMAIDGMINEVCRQRGFEDKWTIWFCGLCEDEKLTTEQLSMALVAALAMPYLDEDEDEE